VEGALAPEADVTRDLYEQYANQIFRYCLHQLGSREEAEDAVQSTFLNAFRGIKRGVVPELEAAWLFKIAHNVCLSRRRSAWRRGRVESPADFDVVEELAPAPARRADELIGFQGVLERMPEAQRRAILLREWQGLSYREIADELELSQAAVETLIFRARRSLASGLEQPPETVRRRAARAFDWGNVAAGAKSLAIGGSAAAKVAATVAVVSATTVVATAPVQQHQRHRTVPAPVTAAKAPVKRHAVRVHRTATRTTARASAAAPAHVRPKRTPVVRMPVSHTSHTLVRATPAPVAPVTARPDSTPPVVEQPAPPVSPQPIPPAAPVTPAPVLPSSDAEKRDVDKAPAPTPVEDQPAQTEIVRTPSALPVQTEPAVTPAVAPVTVSVEVSVDVSQPSSPAVSVSVGSSDPTQSVLSGSFNPVG
jgi:RNA polymerase sigma factor (sigma-70 family)